MIREGLASKKGSLFIALEEVSLTRRVLVGSMTVPCGTCQMAWYQLRYTTLALGAAVTCRSGAWAQRR